MQQAITKVRDLIGCTTCNQTAQIAQRKTTYSSLRVSIFH